MQCFQFLLWLKELIVSNGILIFWITINPANLQYLFVIYLANVEHESGIDIQSTF